MSDLTTYEIEDGIATIAMDDGKANAFSPAMIDELNARLDRAEADEAIVVLTGRERTFSGGFDLRCPPEQWPAMVGGGARLAERLLAFPHPTIAACNGNAVAMAGFALLACDVRIGVAGDFRIGLNEVAIGLTMPWFALALSRHRLTPPAFDRCCVTGVLLDPREARAAGFLDRLVDDGDALRAAALKQARALAALDRRAHAATKLRVRERALAEVREGIERIGGSQNDW
jgi:enoyl-CoA hydratase